MGAGNGAFLLGCFQLPGARNRTNCVWSSGNRFRSPCYFRCAPARFVRSPPHCLRSSTDRFRFPAHRGGSRCRPSGLWTYPLRFGTDRFLVAPRQRLYGDRSLPLPVPPIGGRKHSGLYRESVKEEQLRNCLLASALEAVGKKVGERHLRPRSPSMKDGSSCGRKTLLQMRKGNQWGRRVAVRRENRRDREQKTSCQ